MLLLVAYLLGYLTCYLEVHGMNGPAWLSGLTATGMVAVRLLAGFMLQPAGKRFYRWAKKENTRAGRVLLFVLHYSKDHPGHHRACQSCVGSTDAS